MSSHFSRWRSAHLAPVAVPSISASAAAFRNSCEFVLVWVCVSVVVHNASASALALTQDNGGACLVFRQNLAWSLTVNSRTCCRSRISWVSLKLEKCFFMILITICSFLFRVPGLIGSGDFSNLRSEAVRYQLNKNMVSFETDIGGGRRKSSCSVSISSCKARVKLV